MALRIQNGKWKRTAFWMTFFLIIFGVEFLTYFFQAGMWDKLYCPTGSHCTSFLLVADPQILGEQDEPNWITIWDNDRYLRRTYALAMSHVKPNAVIFLGDLMDEGNRADDLEFERYVDRFFSIFPPDLTAKSFFLPGDNDIGGENGDPILPSTVNRFRQTFHKRIELTVGSCRILKVNPVLEPIPHQNPSQASADKLVRIAVSHFPLLGMSTPFTQKILKDYKPHLILSAHSHLSRIRGPSVIAPKPLISKLGPLNLVSKTKESDNDDGWNSLPSVHEIEVPTCSYRMGVADMGYGYLLIDETRKELQYVVLWLPARMSHLKFYVAFAMGFSLIFLWWFLCGYGRAHSHMLLNHKS